jgi:RNA recognition motif-containing protein
MWRGVDGWAVVTFKSEDAARNAMVSINGTTFRGKVLTTKWASASVRHFI